MRRTGGLRPKSYRFAHSWLALLGLLVACGRFDYERIEAAVPLASEGILARGPFGIAPRIDGPGVVVAYAEFPVGVSTGNLVLARAVQDGAAEGEPVIVATLDLTIERLFLFAEADGYRLFHVPYDTGDVVVTGVDASGMVRDTEVLTGRRHFHVAPVSAGYMASFKRGGAPTQAHVELMDGAGVPMGEPTPIEATAENQDYPITAQSGDQYGLLFRDQRNGGRRVRFVTVDANLAVIGASAEILPAEGTQRPLALLEDGEGGFIAGVDHDGAPTFLRLDSAGATIWSEPAGLPPNRRDSPDLSLRRVDDVLGIAWQGDNETLPRIYFTTMSVSNGAVGVIEQLSADDTRAREPATTYVDGRFATVYESALDGYTGPFLRWSGP